MKVLSKLDSLDNVQDGSTRKLITKTTSSGSGNVVSSVSVSGDTITYTKGVTALTGHQNAFSNVKVGSSTVAADQAGDTLELVAGSNVTLTPDTTNDKVTIAATDTTYESKAAASGGTAVSLVTTGEKYTWNNKLDSSALNNYVTLNTEQTITGNKTFNGTLKMSYINNATYATSSTTNLSPSATGLANPPWNKDLWHDHFAFLRYHTIDSQETSTNGTTWTTASKDLKNLFIQKEETTTAVLAANEIGYRFTLKNSTFAYSGVSWFEMGVAYTNPFSSFRILIEHSADLETWNTCHDSIIAGNSQPYFLRNGYTIQSDGYTRFTFIKQSNLDTGLVRLTCIKALCTRKGDQGLGSEYEYPYDWDNGINLLPISDNNRNLGSSNRKWANVYATTFNGNLTGTATKATGDKNGNDITTTYAVVNHNHSKLIVAGDNRDIATKPNDYVNDFIFQGIKTSTAIGSPSSATYSYLFGLRGWPDDSGGNAWELAFNNNGIYARKGATTEFGSWNRIDIDTKNTAGSTDTSSKIYLIGATSQAANPQTYSDNEIYATSGVLTTKSVQVGGTAATMQYNSTDKCIEFVFA